MRERIGGYICWWNSDSTGEVGLLSGCTFERADGGSNWAERALVRAAPAPKHVVLLSLSTDVAFNGLVVVAHASLSK
jgi:hypothetical protein